MFLFKASETFRSVARTHRNKSGNQRGDTYDTLIIYVANFVKSFSIWLKSNMSLQELGHSDEVIANEIGDTCVIIFRRNRQINRVDEGKGDSIVGCPLATVLLRGATDAAMDNAERAMQVRIISYYTDDVIGYIHFYPSFCLSSLIRFCKHLLLICY